MIRIAPALAATACKPNAMEPPITPPGKSTVPSLAPKSDGFMPDFHRSAIALFAIGSFVGGVPDDALTSVGDIVRIARNAEMHINNSKTDKTRTGVTPDRFSTKKSMAA